MLYLMEVVTHTFKYVADSQLASAVVVPVALIQQTATAGTEQYQQGLDNMLALSAFTAEPVLLLVFGLLLVSVTFAVKLKTARKPKYEKT